MKQMQLHDESSLTRARARHCGALPPPESGLAGGVSPEGGDCESFGSCGKSVVAGAPGCAGVEAGGCVVGAGAVRAGASSKLVGAARCVDKYASVRLVMKNTVASTP